MPVKRERMKRGRCPCECQIALECWGRGLSSLHRSTPHFLPSSFCLSLFFLFSLCLTHTFFHFLILFQSPLAHCSPSLSFFFFFSLSFSVISLQCTCSPSWLPFSLIILSSVYPFSLLAPPLFILSLSLFLYICPVSILTPTSLFLPCTRSPSWFPFFFSLFLLSLFLSLFLFLPCTCSPFWLYLSSFFLQLTHSPSWLPPPLFSICLSFFIYNQSPSWLPCLFFLPRAHSPSWLPRVPSVSRSPSLTHSSECDRQVLVTVEASSRARLLFGSAVPDLQPACPTFKWAVSLLLSLSLSVPLDSRIPHQNTHARLLLFA